MEQMELPDARRAHTALGRILVADEEGLAALIADMLIKQGYYCDCASDRAAAERMLKSGDYDMVVINAGMLEHQGLSAPEQAAWIPDGIQVILLSDTPSLPASLMSMKLRTTACMVKPIDHAEMLRQVEAAMGSARTHHSLRSAWERTQGYSDSLNDVVNLIASPGASALPISAFMSLTFQNIAGSLIDLRNVTDALLSGSRGQEACSLLNCPRLNTLMDAVLETIDVLERTKGSFKSKELGDLRKKLSALVNGTATGRSTSD